MFPIEMSWLPLDHARTVHENEVLAFEKVLGSRLPDDYRTFLLKFNGGRPRPKYWERSVKWPAALSSLDQDLPMISLYGLGVLGDDSLDSERSSLEDEIPPHALPIGRSVSPIFLLMLDGPRRGQVLGWLTDTWQDQTDPDQLGFAAASFSDFLAGLAHVPPG